MLNLQKYLLNNSLNSLTEKFGIQIKHDPEFSNLVLFKYDQIESHSHMGNQIVQECRGIILDEFENWRVVSRAFDKFFNYGEIHAAKIDWASALVQEKVDGSLCTLYNYHGIWRVSTTGSPNAGGNVNNDDLTFAEYFWETFQKCNYNLAWFDPNYCYYFELVGPNNRVVIIHNQSNLILLGARYLITQKEVFPEHFAHEHNIQYVKHFSFSSFDDIMKSLKEIKGSEQEGFVVVDWNFNRIKIKHPDYVLLHQMKSDFSEKRCLDVIRNGETSEVTSYFPEFREIYNRLYCKYELLISDIDQQWRKFRGINDQKEYALAIKDLSYSGLLFSLKNGKINTIRQGIKEMRLEYLMELIQKC